MNSKLIKNIVFTGLVLSFLTGGVLLFLSRPQKVLSDSLIGFNEGYGATTHDSSGSVSGTITNALWQSPDLCLSQNCLLFDGTGDYVSFGDESTFDFAETANFTIEFWFRTPDITSGTRTLISKYRGDDTEGGYKIYMSSDGKINFGVDDDNSWTPDDIVTSPSAYDDARWHHVTAIKTGTTSLSLHIDAQKVGEDLSISATGSLVNDDSFVVGAEYNGSTNPYTGFIDELKIYTSTARSADQVKTDYLGVTADMGTSSTFGSGKQWLNNGLIGYWKLNDNVSGNNQTIADSSGNYSNGTTAYGANTTGMDCTVTGKYYLGCDLDGTDDRIWLGSSATLLKPDQLTLSAWFKADASNGVRPIIGRYHESTPYTSYQIGYSYGAFMFQLNVDNSKKDLPAPTVPSTGQWYHVIGTYNGSRMSLYLNGVLVNYLDISGSIIYSTGASWDRTIIGNNYSGSQFFDGLVDDVRIYNRALSPSEVSQLYAWAPEPIAYWKLDENTGTNAADSSISGNDLTLTNSPLWNTGKFGSGLSFGTTADSHLLRSDDSDFNFIDDANMTYEVWFKHATATNQEIILSKYQEAGYKMIMESDGNITCALDYDSTWTPTDSITSTAATYDDGNWHHLACVKSAASSLSLYIDGVLIGSYSSLTATNTLTNSDPLYIGIDADGTSNDYTGSLDEIKIYNYARTSTQIIEDMNAGHPAPGSPIGSAVAQWKFDEGYGTTAYDSSINANNLTLSSASWTNSGKFGKAYNGASNVRLTRDDDPDFDFANGSDDFTLSVWFNRGGAISNTEYLLDKHNSNDGFTLYMDSDGDIVCGIGDGTSFPEDIAGTANANYDDTSWHHAACVKSGTSSLKLYLDGKEVASDPSLGADGDMSNSGKLIIGDTDEVDGTDEWLGDIDEIAIYRSVLTSDQIKVLYNQGQSEVIGALSTTSSGTADWSSDRSYCPPGDTTVSCSPAAIWKFDENTGSDIYDSSTNSNNGTLTGTPSWATGKFGSSFNFSGSSDLINAQSGGSIDNTFDDGGSISVWLYIRSDGGSDLGRILHKDNDTNSAGWRLITQSESAGFVAIRLAHRFTSSTGGWNTGSVVPLNQWVHFALNYNNSSTSNDAEFFLNGQKITATEDATPANTRTSDSAQNLYIGNMGTTNRGFDGKIDELKIFRYQRSASQIAWDYNQGAPAVWYKMDECSDATLNNSSPQANGGDAGNDATIYPVSNGNTAVGTCVDSATTMWYNGRTGKYSSSVDFDGSDDYAATSNTALLASDSVSYSNLTWGGWFKPATDTDDDTLILKGLGTGSTTNEFRLTTAASTGLPQCEIYYSSAWHVIATGLSRPTTGSWSHILCSYDGVNGKIYVNGILSGSVAETNSITSSSSSPLTLASDPANGSRTEFFDGLIDEVKIFSYALSSQQIKTDYNQGSAVIF